MARVIVVVCTTIFFIMMLARWMYTYIYPGTLPFNMAILDWLLVASGAGASISAIFCFIKKDTLTLLSFFRCSALFVIQLF